MTLFRPVEKKKATVPPKAGERGARGVRYSTTSVEEDARAPKRRQRSNKTLDKSPRGFLCGNPQRGFYDLDGCYCRRRGRKVVVELFGPRAALAALTEEDRALVMNARQAARRRDGGGVGDDT